MNNIIDAYHYVLSSADKRFPRGFWTDENRFKRAKIVTCYLIEKVLKWSDDDIKANLRATIFSDYKLSGMMRMLFEGSPYKALNNAYPGRFKQFELKEVSQSYWNFETAREALDWLFNKKLNWSTNDIIKNISIKTFDNNGLSGVANLFHDSMYETLSTLYPDTDWTVLKQRKGMKKVETNKATHGGYRPGAGRKPTGRKKINFYVTKDETKKIKEFIEKLRAAE